MDTDTVKVPWDLKLAHQMVRQRNNALIYRQRTLQYQQQRLSEQLTGLRFLVNRLGDAIAVVEKAGGDAHNLRTQIKEAHAEINRITPRYTYLEQATTLLAANLRLIDHAHDSLHWLCFEDGKLAEFDKIPEVPQPERKPSVTVINQK